MRDPLRATPVWQTLHCDQSSREDSREPVPEDGREEGVKKNDASASILQLTFGMKVVRNFGMSVGMQWY